MILYFTFTQNYAILRVHFNFNSQLYISSVYDLEVTPVPIPNTKVKLLCADGTAGVALWKSRSMLGNGSLAQLVRATGS